MRKVAGYDLRMLATKADLGNHTNLDAVATSEQEHVDDCVGGSDKDSMMEQEKLSRRGVVSDVIGIVNPIDHLAPTNIKYEMSEPLQDKLVEEICESSEAGSNEINETEGGDPKESLEDTTTQDGAIIANNLEEIYESTQEIFELAKAGINETEDAGPEEMPRDAA